MPINSVYTREDVVINVDPTTDHAALATGGWRMLTAGEIEAANIVGYEHLVSPANTVVNADGSITFTPPAPPTEAELYERLRAKTERRLAATDQYGMDDYPDNDKRAAYRAYRAELRGINHQPGAPWDGGGELTPWPVKPEI